MPPARTIDTRTDAQSVRERQIAAAAHARASKKNLGQQQAQQQNGMGTSSLRELMRISDNSNGDSANQPGQGMAWQTAPLALLNTYRISHNIPSPAAFTSPFRQALLSNPGIGRQSPTMAKRKDKRRVSKEQLALAVRKHFNGAAVSENDVVTELVYKVRNQNKAFRMRSVPAATKKP